jgi:hypothetical protein
MKKFKKFFRKLFGLKPRKLFICADPQEYVTFVVIRSKKMVMVNYEQNKDGSYLVEVL